MPRPIRHSSLYYPLLHPLQQWSRPHHPWSMSSWKFLQWAFTFGVSPVNQGAEDALQQAHKASLGHGDSAVAGLSKSASPCAGLTASAPFILLENQVCPIWQKEVKIPCTVAQWNPVCPEGWPEGVPKEMTQSGHSQRSSNTHISNLQPGFHFQTEFFAFIF